jgi:CRP-like cAMP-binding protein
MSLCTRGEAQVRGAIAFAPMAEDTSGDGLRERLTRQGEDALGRIAQDLLENPLINGAIARAFEARERAAQAQEVALGALNLPSASDIERLTRRVRSLSQRLEGIEDGVDRLDERLAALQTSLDGVAKELAALRKASPAKPAAKRSGAGRSTAPRST